MALATATALAIGLGVSAAAGAAQAVSGASRAKKAKKALENFQRQDLENVAKDLRISTLGAEMQTASATRQAESSIQALRTGGVRGIVGGAAQVGAQQAQVQQSISADLDQQEVARQQAIAQEEANIRGMQEKREGTEIAGLGQEMQAGQQQMWTGIQGVAGAAVGLSGAMPDAKPVIEGAGTASLQNQASGAGFFAGSSPGAQSLMPGNYQNNLPSLTANQTNLMGSQYGNFGGLSAPGAFNPKLKKIGLSTGANPFTGGN